VDSNTAFFGVAGGLAAVVFAVVLIVLVLRAAPGNERMREIAAAIQEGASAYLNRQYAVIAVIGVIVAVVIGFTIGWNTAELYVLGAALSAGAGYVGMNISVRSNLRTAEAARGGLNKALSVAFRGGAVTGPVRAAQQFVLDHVIDQRRETPARQGSDLPDRHAHHHSPGCQRHVIPKDPASQ